VDNLVYTDLENKKVLRRYPVGKKKKPQPQQDNSFFQTILSHSQYF